MSDAREPTEPRPRPPAPAPDASRSIELETKLAFLEQTVDDLNEVVIDQARRLERLEDRLARIEGRVAGEGDPAQAPMAGQAHPPDGDDDDRRADLLAERPPHY